MDAMDQYHIIHSHKIKENIQNAYQNNDKEPKVQVE